MSNNINKIKLVARLTDIILLILIFPFYFGYGSPFPNKDLSFFENIWLIIIPIFLAGLLIAFKREKLGAFTVIIPILLGLIVSIISNKSPAILMVLPIIPAILFLISSYQKNN